MGPLYLPTPQLETPITALTTFVALHLPIPRVGTHMKLTTMMIGTRILLQNAVLLAQLDLQSVALISYQMFRELLSRQPLCRDVTRFEEKHVVELLQLQEEQLLLL